MTKSKIRDSPEAKRWLIIGAYQAGASEKHVARISGLSKTAVRNIILNYQRTGTPCIPKKIPNKIKQKLVVEYDDNGEIIDTDDEDEVQEILPPPPIPTQSTKKSITKKKPFVSIRNKPKSVTTKDIINYAMDQMRITDNNHINISAQKLVEESTPEWNKSHQQQQHKYPQFNHNQQQHQLQYQFQSASSSSSSSASNQPTSTTTKKRLPPPSKYDQNIRGYELWTHDDDMLLLSHVLHHLHGGGWNELEVRFEGRHSARLCYDRWKHLKSRLLKGITDKPNTPW